MRLMVDTCGSTLFLEESQDFEGEPQPDEPGVSLF